MTEKLEEKLDTKEPEAKEPEMKEPEAKSEAKPKRGKTKKVAIRMIESLGESVLVEWMDGDDYFRAIVPRTETLGGEADAQVLAAGVPYGFDWSQVELQPLDPKQLKRELNRRGIWTADDVGKNPNQVQVAINVLSGLMRSRLFAAAKTEEE